MGELRRNNSALVTTEFVLLEVANALCALAWRDKAVKLIDGLRPLSHLRIISADSSLLADGWHLYSNRLDKEWSLTDCVSIVVMRNETSNRHLLPTIISSRQDLSNCSDNPHCPITLRTVRQQRVPCFLGYRNALSNQRISFSVGALVSQSFSRYVLSRMTDEFSRMRMVWPIG